MLKSINRCDIYILLNVLYSLQGLLYPPGIINQLLQFVILFWAMIECTKVFRYRIHSPILKSLNLLVIMYCIYGLWNILFAPTVFFSNTGESPSKYVYLQNSLKSLLPIYMFYLYTRKGLLNTNRIMVYTIILLLISIKSFYENSLKALEELDSEESTNNAAYGFVNLIPALYFFRKKKIIQYSLLAILGIFILIGMKRGAMLIGGVSILIFLYSDFKNGSSKMRLTIFFLSIVLIVVGIYYVSDMMETNLYFEYRVEQSLEGDSSGRDTLYSTLWNSFVNESNLLYVMFGKGADATIGIAGNYAHNDWLETISNNGIIGGLLLLSFFNSLFKTLYKQRKRLPPYMYYPFLILVLIMFCKTLFSMSIQSIGIMHTLLLGYFIYWSTKSKDEIEYKILN